MKLPIYMDNHSTTPCDPRVVDAMLPFFTEKFGNSASRNHSFGWESEEAVELARKQIARLIHADSKEIVFTSGATESDNLALKGVAEMYRQEQNDPDPPRKFHDMTTVLDALPVTMSTISEWVNTHKEAFAK